MNSEHDAGPVMHVSRMDAFLNRWFNTYEEARAALDSDGGYLFACRHQYFVTTGAAVRELGLDPEDLDWQHIGFDWVQPADTDAWERHCQLSGARRESRDSLSTAAVIFRRS